MRASINAFLITVAILFTATPAMAEIHYRTGFQLDWWDSDAGDRGTQYHLPLEISTETDDMAFKVLTAYAHNDVESSDGSSRTFSGTVDTRVNMDYMVIDRWPVDVLFALDLNLPTGQTALSPGDAISIANADKVTITRMGEGFNINPGISVVKQWDSLLAAAGLGYIFRGQHDAAETLKDYDPGDAFNFNAELEYHFNDRLTAHLVGSHTQFDKDRLDGDDYFQPGDVNIFGSGITYTTDSWMLSGSFQSILREKNELSYGSGVLIDESHNSYGDEWVTDLRGRMKINEKTDVSLWLQRLTLSENGYPSTHSSYTSDRAKTTIGVEINHHFNTAWELGVKLQRFTMAVDNNPVDTTDTDFDGGTASVWVSAHF